MTENSFFFKLNSKKNTLFHNLPNKITTKLKLLITIIVISNRWYLDILT